MQNELNGGSGKVIYKVYIHVISNYFFPIFGKYDVANVNVKPLSQCIDWRDAKMELAIEERLLTKTKKLVKVPTQAKNSYPNIWEEI